MDQIEIKVLNPESLKHAKKMMVAGARLTQHGHEIESLKDFMKLYNQSYTNDLVENLLNLPHPTLQKFEVINVVIIGASRRFLTQITRHQNEVKFMSASLQYSDYSNKAQFVVPYDLLQNNDSDYLISCSDSLEDYNNMIKRGASHDDAAYLIPNGQRNALIISATPYQWKHMIKQRVCNRNSSETRYVMLKIWEELSQLDSMFFDTNTGPDCITSDCKEGHMSCFEPLEYEDSPADIIKRDFKKLAE